MKLSPRVRVCSRQNGLRFVWRNSDEVPGDDSESGPTMTPPSWLCPITFPWNSAPNGPAGSAKRAMMMMRPPGHPHGDGDGMLANESSHSRALLPVDVTFLVWVYEWPSPSSQ